MANANSSSLGKNNSPANPPDICCKVQVDAKQQNHTLSTKPLVAIFLCTKDGDRFLKEQLDSILKQRDCGFNLWVSDDGSTDDTLRILKSYQSSWGTQSLSIEPGPQQGYAANFLSLASRASIEADYYAFADQDDIWEPDKLSRAIDKLRLIDEDVPALYCARTRLIDQYGKGCGYTPIRRRRPSFANSLVQSLASGNSMVMNKAAHNLLCKAGQLNIISHDWWVYSLVTGSGGIVIYDKHPSVRYRQHDQNVLGASPGLRATHKRIYMLFQRRFQQWNAIHTKALDANRELLTTENAIMLDKFSKARVCRLIPRTIGIWRSGVYRQTLIGGLGLFAATLFDRI